MCYKDILVFKTKCSSIQQAFKTWRWTTAKERSILLKKWCELCRANVDELANILTTEMGKPIAEAKGEVMFGANFLEWYSEEAKRNYGDVST